MSSFNVRVESTPGLDMVLSNAVHLSDSLYSSIYSGSVAHAMIINKMTGFEHMVSVRRYSDQHDKDSAVVYLSNVQRLFCHVSVGDDMEFRPLSLRHTNVPRVGSLCLRLEIIGKKPTDSMDETDIDLENFIHNTLQRTFIPVKPDYVLAFQYHKPGSKSDNLLFTAQITALASDRDCDPQSAPERVSNMPYHILDYSGKVPHPFLFITSGDPRLKLNVKRVLVNNIFKGDFDLISQGVGGMSKQFAEIFRRAFLSRVLPGVSERWGTTHVKGIMLYGPPGTGKTLIARHISTMLKSREPKVVTGPEILNKYVGQSEENIRNLFADAEKEEKERGAESGLHVIILDEIDAICKQRGSSGSSTGVNDSVVNQFLSKIDGVNALNNVLLIGMTNRLDMIDDALLRPGRFELHIEISLPDNEGRKEILNIHTKPIRESGALHDNVDLGDIAARTKNFTGSEVAGLVRSAASAAMQRYYLTLNSGDTNQVKEKSRSSSNECIIEADDFDVALSEVKPMFGRESDTVSGMMPFGVEMGIFPSNFTSEFSNFQKWAETLSSEESNVNFMSALLVGKQGSGKSALSAYAANLTQYPLVKVISPRLLKGTDEHSVCNQINHIFADAIKVDACVILDDIDDLCGYIPGSVHSAAIWHISVINLLKKWLRPLPMKSDSKKKQFGLFVIATVTDENALRVMGLANRFRRSFQIPLCTMQQAQIQLVPKHPKLKKVIQNISQRNDEQSMDFEQVGIPIGHLFEELAFEN